MTNSICRFLPAKNYTGNLKTIHFVFEADIETLKQPFCRQIHYIQLVTRGIAVLKMGGKEYTLKPGSVFFSFPGIPFEILNRKNFEYVYISFMGSCVFTILENLKIDPEHCVYAGLDGLIDFWLHSIRRTNQLNANLLAESVLLYTLSFIDNQSEDPRGVKNSENVIDMVVDYADNHYMEQGLSLKRIARLFAYTEKHLSLIFKKEMGIGFNHYLKNVRIQHALELMRSTQLSVAEISEQCGFSDPLYFS